MKKTIAIVTGGTGGHVFPAVSLSEELDFNDYKIVVFLDKRANVYKNKFNHQITIKKISSLGLHRKSILFLIKMFFLLFIGFMQTFYIFLRSRPKILVSFGSYASLPVVLNAIIFRVPIVMHEQNAYLGKAHRLLVKFAKVLVLTFRKTSNVPQNVLTKHGGLPIRNEFSLLAKQEVKKENYIITILGGSQGANIFGNIFPETFSSLPKKIKDNLKIYHQCKPHMIEEIKNKWQEVGINVEIKAFFDNIANIIWQSDLIIARSGSSTIAEISTIGRYAIYIPFAKATANHQELNANNARDDYGASILLEKDFKQENLFILVNDFFNNLDKYLNGVKKITCNPSLELKNIVLEIIS